MVFENIYKYIPSYLGLHSYSLTHPVSTFGLASLSNGGKKRKSDEE